MVVHVHRGCVGDGERPRGGVQAHAARAGGGIGVQPRHRVRLADLQAFIQDLLSPGLRGVDVEDEVRARAIADAVLQFHLELDSDHVFSRGKRDIGTHDDTARPHGMRRGHHRFGACSQYPEPAAGSVSEEGARCASAPQAQSALVLQPHSPWRKKMPSSAPRSAPCGPASHKERPMPQEHPLPERLRRKEIAPEGAGCLCRGHR